MLILLVVIDSIGMAQDATHVKRIAYYDAIVLRKAMDSTTLEMPNDNDTLNQILSYYLGGIDVSSLALDNPYLAKYFPTGEVASMTTEAAKEVGNSFSIKAGNIGGINVSNIADGIARFLIKRGKEELNAAFFRRLQTFLEKNDECKILFPNTCEFFRNVASFRYAEFIQGLREAFYKDLSNLIIGLNQLIDLPKYQKLLVNLPEIRVAIRSIRIISELSQSTDNTPINPAILIEHLAALNEWPEIHPNLGNAWKLLEIVSNSIRNQDNTRIWVPLTDLNKLISDSVTRDLFLGLFYEQVKGIDFKIGRDSVSLKNVMDSAKKYNAVFSVTSMIENFALLTNDIDRTILDYKDKKAKGNLSNDDYYTYISKAINITEYGFRMANTLKPNLINDHYIVIAKSGNELYKNIYSKDYNSAVKNAYNILDQVFNHAQDLVQEKKERIKLNDEHKRVLDGVSSSLDSTAKQRFSDSLLNIQKSEFENSFANDNLPTKKFLESFLKYGNFLASVVKAESAAEVEAALDATALPAGSYSIKQNSHFNVSLNGYIGYGWDIDKGNGFYAPIGFSFNMGLGKKKGGALSIFTAIIDVGSIVSYRLKNGNDEDLKQEVRLESIFAPSAQLLFEIPRLPIAFGPGWRRTPKLFYSSSTNFTVVPAKDVINISVLIDIPIFTLTNRSYKK